MPLVPPGADQLKRTFLRKERGRGRETLSRGQNSSAFLSSSLGHCYHFCFVALFFYILSAIQPTANPWSHESDPGPSRAGIPGQLCPCNPSVPNPISPPHPGQLPQLAGNSLEQRNGPGMQERQPKGQLWQSPPPKQVALDKEVSFWLECPTSAMAPPRHPQGSHCSRAPAKGTRQLQRTNLQTGSPSRGDPFWSSPWFAQQRELLRNSCSERKRGKVRTRKK